MRLGYACINETLKAKKIRANRNCKKATFQSKGLAHVRDLIDQNLDGLLQILQWNYANNIFVYRMSSDMIPWGSEFNFEDLPNWPELQAKFAAVGQYALDHNIRLSFHPGQFCVLASPTESSVLNAVRELNVNGKVMDLLLQPRNHLAKINIHLGGTYGGPKQPVYDRFIANFNLLDESVKTRLTLENDDRESLYSVEDLYHGICKHINIPIVFDYHHWQCHPGSLSQRDALKLALSTWGDIRPCCHYSETAQIDDPTKMFKAHSRLIHSVIDDYGFDFDCVIEAKGKELALLHYRNNVLKSAA